MDENKIKEAIDVSFTKNKDVIAKENKEAIDKSAVEMKADYDEKLELFKKESNDKLEHALATMKGPADNSVSEFEKIDKDDNGTVLKRSFSFTKMQSAGINFAGATLSVAGLAGRNLMVIETVRPLFTTDVYAMLGTTIPVATHSVKVNNFTDPTFIVAGKPAIIGGKTGSEYALNDETVNIITHDCLVEASSEAINDLPSLPTEIVASIVRAASRKQATESIATIKATATNNIKTGVENGLPTSDNIVEKIESLITSVAYEYQDSVALIMSRQMISLLRIGAAKSFDMNAVDQLTRYNGIPIYQSSHVEPGTADDQLVASFGNFQRGMSLYVAENFAIEDDGYRLGAWRWYGRFGSKLYVKENLAFANLIVGE